MARASHWGLVGRLWVSLSFADQKFSEFTKKLYKQTEIIINTKLLFTFNIGRLAEVNKYKYNVSCIKRASSDYAYITVQDIHNC